MDNKDSSQRAAAIEIALADLISVIEEAKPIAVAAKTEAETAYVAVCKMVKHMQGEGSNSS